MVHGEHHISTVTSDVNLSIEDVHLSNLKDFLYKFNKLLHSLGARTGSGRSAAVAGNKGGHQKTSTFCQAVLAKVQDFSKLSVENFDKMLLRKEVEISPKGGLTDVGLHTGGLCPIISINAFDLQIVI